MLLFKKKDDKKELYLERLNKIIDNINRKQGKNTLGWGASIIEEDWIARREKLSYLKTSTVENIPTVFAT